MIFTIPKIISFLSQGTTLERGTVVMTGTGPGVGAMRTPKVTLKHGDDICVEIENIGTKRPSPLQDLNKSAIVSISARLPALHPAADATLQDDCAG
ncbi:hypothetical protein E4U49_000292 [Claviceps purpurea]|nr:hypothetical protein E4U49_000292 [Claviceps purpurea]